MLSKCIFSLFSFLSQPTKETLSLSEKSLTSIRCSPLGRPRVRMRIATHRAKLHTAAQHQQKRWQGERHQEKEAETVSTSASQRRTRWQHDVRPGGLRTRTRSAEIETVAAHVGEDARPALQEVPPVRRPSRREPSVV
mmetsp:Transcript_6771/g.20597  ORF Transcript_6771/g.20597 Transcript_6771/m.20597 type:complete len:138 (-) Transcript_6771:87-500(-)